MLDTSKQQLVFIHAGGGTGKTYVTCKFFEKLASRGEICRCTCPTGVGASHLPQGRTFHSVDKVSMLSTNFIVLVDTRLRSMYDPDKLFGGISILFIGDFVQLPVTTGRDLWSVMYGIVSGNDANARNLFQKFQVHELTANMRSAECETHSRRVAAFRVLPPIYPFGQK